MRSLAQQRLGTVIHMEHSVLKLFEKRFDHLFALLQPFIRNRQTAGHVSIADQTWSGTHQGINP